MLCLQIVCKTVVISTLLSLPFDVDVIETVARNLKVVELFCTFVRAVLKNF